MTTAARQASGTDLDVEHLIGLRRNAPGTLARGLSALPGAFVTRKRGTGQDAADSRLYVSGDELRHLDRGATARTGDLHVRTFQEERDRVAILVADFRPSMFWGTGRALCAVAAAEVLAIAGWDCADSGGRVGLVAIGGPEAIATPPRARTRGMLGVIGAMVRAFQAARARLRTHPQDPPLDLALSGLGNVAPKGAQVIIASDFEQPGLGFEGLVGDLERRRTVSLIHVEDRASADLPPGFYPALRQDGARVQLEIGRARPPSAREPGRVYVDAGGELEDLAREIRG